MRYSADKPFEMLEDLSYFQTICINPEKASAQQHLRFDLVTQAGSSPNLSTLNQALTVRTGVPFEVSGNVVHGNTTRQRELERHNQHDRHGLVRSGKDC